MIEFQCFWMTSKAILSFKCMYLENMFSEEQRSTDLLSIEFEPLVQEKANPYLSPEAAQLVMNFKADFLILQILL